MKTKPDRMHLRLRLIAAATCLVLLTSCATEPAGPQAAATSRILREARTPTIPLEQRAVDYLEAASESLPGIASDNEPSVARETYNSATAELTALLRSADGGRLWHRSVTLTGPSKTYHLKLQPAERGTWSPDYFTSFEEARKVHAKLIDARITQPGVGGALVGIRQRTPREPFTTPRGITAPVTATVDFRGSDATLTLHAPAAQSTAMISRKSRRLDADYSAPLGYYRPPSNLLLVGLFAALRSNDYMDKTGLYFLQPYDPDRIPVVFIHGLASTPFTWMEAMNALGGNPRLRERYQFWVFAYPTGNPILYSALRLREELAKVDKLYPNHRPYVLVGHSMGGIIAHAQVTTVTRQTWERVTGDAVKGVFERNAKDSLIIRVGTFEANPRIRRVVYVCTPHRGSKLAIGGIGKLAISLIKLPFAIAHNLATGLTGEELVRLTGSEKRLPTSVSGLSPTNPALKVLNSVSSTAPYHSIIGDRGKGDSPNSTDGVVPYASSHMDGAKAERIVPGPHSSCELPQTIAELDRIMVLHLKN